MAEIIKDYRDNDALRHSFNELAEETFGLNFEAWYQNGFWSDSYRPYSIASQGKIVANVSVNITNMMLDGSVKHFIQLGTVMTHEACRNQGLIRRIIERIEIDYSGTDGFYLFANDSVLNFYPRFGFRRAKEYQYSRRVSNNGEWQLKPVPMNRPDSWRLLEDTMKRNVFHGSFDMVGNRGLVLFYVAQFTRTNADCHDYPAAAPASSDRLMPGINALYHNPTDTWAIVEPKGRSLFLHNVFSGTLTRLDEVIALLGKDIQNITLGFVPADRENYEVTELSEEDCTLFVKRIDPELMERERLRIPSLSHA